MVACRTYNKSRSRIGRWGGECGTQGNGASYILAREKNTFGMVTLKRILNKARWVKLAQDLRLL
jgi:hypothetical protein